MIFSSDGKALRRSAGFVPQWLKKERGGDASAIAYERVWVNEDYYEQGEKKMEYEIKDVGGDKGAIGATGDMSAAKSVANLGSKPQADPTKIGSDWSKSETMDGPGSQKR